VVSSVSAVPKVDIVDKKILLVLDRNCRLSYQSLADILGMTANAARKRVERLIETRVIEEFVVVLKPAVMGSDYLIALVSTDGTENESEFIDLMGANPNIIQVGQVVTSAGRLYFVNCEYIGAAGLQSIATFLRKLHPVRNVELHTILVDQGKEFEIKKIHLRILKCLLEDARMSISEISQRTRLTARRVSRTIQEMLDSEAFWFAVRWNLSLGDNTEFYLRITYDEKCGPREKIDEWLQTTYPLEYWYSFSLALEPILFAKFVTEHFRDAEQIS
jgi:DNA-binding Lrp family transcriptional regulator